MKSPDTIYLIPGEQIEGLDDGLVWSEDPAPSYADEADEAVKYVRADSLRAKSDSEGDKHD